MSRKYKTYIITSFMIVLSSCRSTEDVFQLTTGNCDIQTAEKIAMYRYARSNKENYKFKVNNIEQDSTSFFIDIVLDEGIKKQIEGNDTFLIIVRGGGAKYTVDKKTCKIVKIKGSE